MASFQVSQNYSLPPAKVWDLFADIGNVADFTPTIVKSQRTNNAKGIGAQRQCDFAKGGIVEEVTAWQRSKKIQFTGRRIWGMPVKSMVATFEFTPADGGSTVVCSLDYQTKFGGLLNGMAKPGMRRAMQGMLDGAAKKLA